MRRAFVTSLALLATVNVAVNQWLPGWLYIPVMAGAGLAVIAIACRAGVTPAGAGLSREALPRAALVGIGIGIVAVAVIVAGRFIPALDDLYRDERAAGIGTAGLLYQALVRIPLGTALGEELMFRAGLLGMALRLWSPLRAVAITSLLFGVWHVLPTISAASGNASVQSAPLGVVVAGAVATTTVAGGLFSWLRLGSGHVIAPIVVHAFVNATAFAAAYAIAG